MEENRLMNPRLPAKDFIVEITPLQIQRSQPDGRRLNAVALGTLDYVRNNIHRRLEVSTGTYDIRIGDYQDPTAFTENDELIFQTGEKLQRWIQLYEKSKKVYSIQLTFNISNLTVEISGVYKP